MRVAKLLAPLLFLTSSMFADAVITSITPAEGPVSGGTVVQIHGSGFSEGCFICSPPLPGAEVTFDHIPAETVRYVSDTLLHAVTPPHIPATVSVTVIQPGSQTTLENAFTYTGDVLSAFEPLLFPIFLPPITGQHGSEFRTTARLWNRSLDEPVTIYGVDKSCSLAGPPLYPDMPYTLAPRYQATTNLLPECSETVGRLLWLPKGDRSVAASLRVWETSRQAENHGVEIPVARLEDFDGESIALLDVPRDGRYRLTLRVYSLGRGQDWVNVSFAGRHFQLPLQRGKNMFEPSYAEWTDFSWIPTVPPLLGETMTVLVEVPRLPETGQPLPNMPIWAFITVTNNETQHITTITPQQ